MDAKVMMVQIIEWFESTEGEYQKVMARKEENLMMHGQTDAYLTIIREWGKEVAPEEFIEFKKRHKNLFKFG